MSYSDYRLCSQNEKERITKITDFDKFKEEMYIMQYNEWKNKLNMGILQATFEDGTKEIVHVSIF